MKDGVRYWSSPYEVFVGDPRTTQFGCYAPVIVNTIQKVLESKDKSNEFVVKNLSGSTPEFLYNEIDNGNPVIVWSTLFMQEPENGAIWHIKNTNKIFQWIRKEHCLVLIGYTKNSVILSDPYDSRGTVEYPKTIFEDRFKKMFSQAVLIEKIV